jgi:hypothetical protein
MKSNKFISLILFLSIIQLSFRYAKENRWKLVKNKNGIKAYTCNDEESDIKKVKVITNIKTKLSALTTLLKDIKCHKNWMYNCINTKMLKIINNTEYYFYTLSNAPWPINKRDNISHTTIKQDRITKKVTFSATGVPSYLKENEGIVRVKHFKSKWEFIPKKNETIDVIFYLQIDVGGAVPSWAINLAVAEGPFQTVQNLIKEIKKDKYKHSKLSFIEEL